jgi:hypothetical protein
MFSARVKKKKKKDKAIKGNEATQRVSAVIS